jgi:uncharacterized phage protein (TIGR02220 family)
MKNNIDYYQHYANADQEPQFKMLRVEYGWEGEGKFWALINRIASSENCILDISKKYNKASIASDLNFTISEFEEFIKYLIHECELIQEIKENMITTETVQKNLDKVMENRRTARGRKKKNLEKVLKGSPELSKSSTDQNNKVKESKSKDKVKEKKKIAHRVILAINKLANKKFILSKTNENFIIPRLNEGFTEADCMKVLNNKIQDPNFDKQYFKPETLFRPSKFEGYLNEDPTTYKPFNKGTRNGKVKNYTGQDDREPVIPQRAPIYK